NTMQGLQTGYPVLGKYYFRGVKDSFTKEGQAIVERMNVLAGDPQYLEPLRAAQGMTGETALGRIGKGLNRIQQKSLGAYGWVDDRHVASIYLGQRAKVLDAWKSARNTEDFINRADLDMFTVAEQQRWRQLLKDGNFERVAVETVADE